MCESMGAPGVVNPTHEYGDEPELPWDSPDADVLGDVQETMQQWEAEADSLMAPRVPEVRRD